MDLNIDRISENVCRILRNRYDDFSASDSSVESVKLPGVSFDAEKVKGLQLLPEDIEAAIEKSIVYTLVQSIDTQMIAALRPEAWQSEDAEGIAACPVTALFCNHGTASMLQLSPQFSPVADATTSLTIPVGGFYYFGTLDTAKVFVVRRPLCDTNQVIGVRGIALRHNLKTGAYRHDSVFGTEFGVARASEPNITGFILRT